MQVVAVLLCRGKLEAPPRSHTTTPQPEDESSLPNQPVFLGFLCSIGLHQAEGTTRDAVSSAMAELRTP